jgi:hypothetical protein
VAGDEVSADRAVEPTADRGVTLADALAAHGPLGVGSALVVALGLCADASALGPDQLGRSIGSLATAQMARDRHGRWRWRPVPAGILDRRPTDNEIASRVGAILFECLTASPLADYLPQPETVRARLRERRPDLAQAVVDLTARLASARIAGGQTLGGVAVDIRRAIGITDAPGASWRESRWTLGAVATALVAAGLLAFALYPRAEAELTSHGLTRDETTLDAVGTEASDRWTAVREFITAFDQQAELERRWRTRIPPGDPRLARIHFRQAWARLERGDLLTAEQRLTELLAPLERGLGPSHPYVRATQMNLATVLDGRGATAEAHEHRERAAAATRTLLGTVTADIGDPTGGPPGPGVLAHVAPLAPELEWFQRRDEGGWYSPLTSTARWLAGERGWQLHVKANGECAATVDVGREPRRIGVSIRRASMGSAVLVSGVRPAVNLQMSGPGVVLVSLDVTSEGHVHISSTGGAEPRTSVIDTAVVASPPYGMSFVAPEGDNGCPLVWWEVKPPE